MSVATMAASDRELLARLRERVLAAPKEQIITCLNPGYYYVVTNAHLAQDKFKGMRILNRCSLVTGNTVPFPSCMKGCEPVHPILKSTTVRPVCSKCMAIFRIHVPRAVQSVHESGEFHAHETLMFVLPRDDWPENIRNVISDPNSRLETAMGEIYWSREESKQYEIKVLQRPLKTTSDLEWEQLKHMPLDDYVQKYAREFQSCYAPEFCDQLSGGDSPAAMEATEAGCNVMVEQGSNWDISRVSVESMDHNDNDITYHSSQIMEANTSSSSSSSSSLANSCSAMVLRQPNMRGKFVSHDQREISAQDMEILPYDFHDAQRNPKW